VADTPAGLGHEIDRSGDPLIRVEGVWKIFGRHADRVIGTPDADLPRAELREKHGCVAAVRDVSFDVWPREVFVVMGLSGSGKSTLVPPLRRYPTPPGYALVSDATRAARRASRPSIAASASR
jgi:glycine betaine/proline transport system ATP-binding protein